MAVKRLLELSGAHVAGPAATAAEAGRLLSKHSPDVALVDFHLRGGELAYGLIARLHDQDVPVIVVSGLGMAELPLVKAAAIRENLRRSTAPRELGPSPNGTRFGEKVDADRTRHHGALDNR